jgi:hypothetical protein
MCVEQITSASEDRTAAPQVAVECRSSAVETVELGRRMVRELEAFLSQALGQAVQSPEAGHTSSSPAEVEPCC